jgi:hypothetical protein
MPQIAGVLSVDTYTYIRSRFRTIALKMYWEPAVLIATQAVAQTLANDFQTAFVTAFGPLWSTDVIIDTTLIRYYSDAGNFEATSAGTFLGAGTQATGAVEGDTTLPDEVNLIIQRRTTGQGRANRGRLYVPSLWEGHNTNGIVTAASVSVVETAAAFMGADTTTTPVLHARLYSRTLDNLQVITLCRAMQNFGEQRRRQAPRPSLPL